MRSAPRLRVNNKVTLLWYVSMYFSQKKPVFVSVCKSVFFPVCEMVSLSFSKCELCHCTESYRYHSCTVWLLLCVFGVAVVTSLCCCIDVCNVCSVECCSSTAHWHHVSVFSSITSINNINVTLLRKVQAVQIWCTWKICTSHKMYFGLLYHCRCTVSHGFCCIIVCVLLYW